MRFRLPSPIPVLIVLASFLLSARLPGQNTAPVPTTFEIISPSDGNASSLINTDFTVNRRIFFGGDFFYPGASNAGGFAGYAYGGNKDLTRVARGNPSGSRLTLGGTEFGADPAFPAVGASYVANLPGSRVLATSYDPDDLGDPAVFPVYTGMNGFIAINEGDTLEINLSGFLDPNNKMIKGDQAADGDYTGRNLKSENGNGIPGPDGANNVTFSALNLPEGATFIGTRFRWVPNFIQGDGTTDNKIRNGKYFIDANISSGSTASEVAMFAGDTSSNSLKVGRGMGELRDSLYVIYFKATDDSNQGNDNAIDSLFIMVNDSLPNPPPRFTTRTMLRKDSLGVQQVRTFNYLAGRPDTLFSVFEGDSVVITFYAQDQDSLQGETNDNIAFGLLWNDNLLGVSKGGTTTGAFSGFSQFIHRPGTVDTLAVDTTSVLGSGGAVTAYRIRIQLPFDLATFAEKADSLVVMVSDGFTIVADTFALKVRNNDRAPIWDMDTTSLPSDSALTFSYNPAGIQPSTVQKVDAFNLNNNRVDSTYFSRYVYDPDFLVHDSLGYPLTFFASGSHQGTLNSNTGLNVFLPTADDTVTYSFSITAKDNNPVTPKSTAQTVRFRVSPAPTISRVAPASASINQEFTIYGSGFGLFDMNLEDTSKVVFYAPDGNGRRQNIQARIISWSKDKIVTYVPADVPVSVLDVGNGYVVPDTIKVMSAIYGGFATYPFTVLTDSSGFENLEVVNITSTSATIRYRTNFTGADSVVVASSSDTLDIYSVAFTNAAKFNHYPTFVEKSSASLTEIRSSVTVFDDQTPPTDGIHVVQLIDLSPNTLYRFVIGSANGIFAADSLHNVNGPYRAKKIDRNTPGKNSGLDAFRLRTLPISTGSGSMFTVKGKAFYSGGAAVNASVTLHVVSIANAADTSLPISTTVGSDSVWQLNLANLRATDGSGFNHSAGDRLLFEFDGSEKGFEQYDTLRAPDGASPMTVRNVRLVPYVAYAMELKTGLNLVGLPLKLFKGQPTDAQSLLSLIPGGLPSISRYVPATGTQETISRSIGGRYIGSSNFSLRTGEGYFVKVNSETTLQLDGRYYTESLPHVTFPAAGLYFISRPAQESNLFYSWDALQILKQVPNATIVIRFNTSLQVYEQYYVSGSGYDGNNFGIDVGQGYILQVTGASSWNPNGSGTLLASTGDRARTGAAEPALVLNEPGRTDKTDKTSLDLRISNITSAAAVVTWIASGADPGRIRLSRPDGTEEQLLVPQALQLSNGLRYAQIAGLKAATEYVYRLEGLNGLGADEAIGGKFTTAPVGAGLYPYSLYGKLVDTRGAALSGRLVLLKLRSTETTTETGILSAISNREGYWVFNLANLKEKDSGQPYAWKEGDQVELTVISGSNSRVFSSTVKPGSPHNLALDLQDQDRTGRDASTGTVPAVLPKAYQLAQNAPNPFNPSTTISFAIPEGAGQAEVRLEVFNLRGQSVATLVSGAYAPGEYHVQWSGADSRGGRVASGVYFYRLTTPGFTATRKMIVLK
jgi:hypothetical protein